MTSKTTQRDQENPWADVAANDAEYEPFMLDPSDTHTLYRIAERAFFKAEQRGFAPGHELEDWKEAECEFLREPPASTRSAS